MKFSTDRLVSYTYIDKERADVSTGRQGKAVQLVSVISISLLTERVK